MFAADPAAGNNLETGPVADILEIGCNSNVGFGRSRRRKKRFDPAVRNFAVDYRQYSMSLKT